jgi:hypothetical protein
MKIKNPRRERRGKISYLSVILSENRIPLFPITLYPP